MSIDFLGNKWPQECMGCLIASGKMEPPGGLLYKSENFHINQDPLVPMEGFLVITSNRHIQRISDLTDDEFSEYSNLIKITRRLIKDIFNIEFVTMVEEEMSIHFHTWFFPWSKKILSNIEKPSLNEIRPFMEKTIESGISESATQY